MKMKLVQLLAKELKEWPEGVTHLTQSEVDCEIYDGIDGNKEDSFAPLDERFYASMSHSEGLYPMVTQDQWQAEREKMNKPKWIRHRGGWMPVGAATIVEVRLRCGDIQKHEACEFLWRHKDCYSAVNIMAYRIIEETKDQEVEEVIPKHMAFGYASKEEMVAQIGEECPFSQVASTAEKTNFGTITYKLEIDATEATNEIDSLVAKWGRIESPLKWRDEIIELEAYEEEFRREREKLIRKLESEGFKLIDHMAPVYCEQIIDMSDWRNWQAGDIVRVVISNDASLPIGNEYVVKEIESSEYEDGMPVAVFMIGDSGDYIWPEDIEYQGRQVFEFIRRP